ncbi:hypothetical protein [Timonella sp. A28]
MTIQMHTCHACDREYEPTQPEQRYCTKTCKQSWKRKLLINKHQTARKTK